MKLLSLYVNNFKKLKFKQPLAFPEGIILVTGLNESGKSTILDAILYALFGRMIRPSQKPGTEEIVSYGTSDCQVKLEFSIGQSKYRVTRELHRTRPGRAILQEVKSDGSTRNLTTSSGETTDEVERLLGGITYNEIVASSVVAQKDLERLIKQRLDDRRKVINIFLNLESFNKVQDELDTDRSSIEGTPRNPGRIVVEQRELEGLQERLKEIREGQAQISDLEDRVGKRKQELTMLEKRYRETDVLYKMLSEYDDAVRVKTGLETEIRDKSSLVDNLNVQLQQYASNRVELEQTRQKIREFEDLKDVRAQLDKASSSLDTIRDLQPSHDQLASRIERLQATISDRQKDLTVQPESLANTNDNPKNNWLYLLLVAAFGTGSILLLFLQQVLLAVPFGSLAVVFLLLHARQIASLSQPAELTIEEKERLAGQQLVEVMETDLRRLKQDLAKTHETLVGTSSQILILLNDIPRYSKLLSKDVVDPRWCFDRVNSAYEKDVQKLSALDNKAGLLQNSLVQEPTVKDRFDTALKELGGVKERLANLQLPQLPVGVIFSTGLLEETSNERDELNEAVSRVSTQIEEATRRQAEIRAFLEENKDIEEKTRLQEANVALLQKELAVIRYGLKGIEQTSESLRNRVKPQVERYMGLILPVITSGRYKAVQLDDDYTVRVFDPDAGEFKPKEVFSGGTEDQMLLAMRLAFALALMPQAKGRNPEFLFLDEPLGSSDRVRRDGILTLMHKELAQNFKQIFLVSHVGDLEAEADAIIQMENGTVREVVERRRLTLAEKPVEIAA